MSRSEAPDRRPLLNIVVGVLILVVAGALFWPRGGDDSPPRSDSLVLTPGDGDTANTLAANESTPVESSSEETGAEATEEIPTETIAADRMPVENATLDDVEDRTTAKISNPEATEQSNPSTRSASSDIAPGSDGRYYLVVGSFRDRANAESLVERLGAAGIGASSVPGDGGNGVVHRVRVGYFRDREAAESFGRNIKSDMQLDSWVGSR